MGFALVFEWLGHETGLFLWKKHPKYSLIKVEAIALTIGIKLDFGFG
jgi:hypothetical protein